MDLAPLFDDLIRVETLLWDAVDRRLREDCDLPLSWFEPLQVINRIDGCRASDIARDLAITEGGTSKLVARIEAAGLCLRLPNPNDARSSLIRLSADGVSRLESASHIFQDELRARLGSAVPAASITEFAAALRLIRTSLVSGALR